MKILIIEDKQSHIEAAKLQLAGHELTICTTYKEAEQALSGEKHKYEKDKEFSYDVVLTDLSLPPSFEGARETGETETPYGLVFALGALRRGIRHVAIVTDSTHHSSPIHWAMDMIGLDNQERIQIGNSFLLCYWYPSNESTRDNPMKNWKGALDKLLA